MPRTRHSSAVRPRPNDEPTFEGRPSEAPGKGMICLAVYNPNRELFKRQLLSIARQTITDWECLVGAAATILQGLAIGERSVIAAGAVVTKDVPPAVVVNGVPGAWT